MSPALSNDVYYSSLEIGPEHVDTAGGYYHMANIFYSQNRIENALALYDKVVVFDNAKKCIYAIVWMDLDAFPSEEAAAMVTARTTLLKSHPASHETW